MITQDSHSFEGPPSDWYFRTPPPFLETPSKISENPNFFFLITESFPKESQGRTLFLSEVDKYHYNNTNEPRPKLSEEISLAKLTSQGTQGGTRYSDSRASVRYIFNSCF